MPNCYDIDQARIVKDLVDDPVFSDPGYEERTEALQLFTSGAGKTDNVFTHSVSTCQFAAAAAGH